MPPALDGPAPLEVRDVRCVLGGVVAVDAVSGAVLRPFVGLGVGGRSFGYRNREPRPQHELTGYTALGGQLRLARVGRGRVDLRVEVRGYATGFKGLTGELARTETRNDLTIATGLAVAL